MPTPLPIFDGDWRILPQLDRILEAAEGRRLGYEPYQKVADHSVWMAPSPHGNKALAAVLGGWQLTGIFTASSGAPLTVRTGVDRSLNGQNLDTADQVGDWRINQSRPRGQEILRWFNTAAFALPPIGTVGT